MFLTFSCPPSLSSLSAVHQPALGLFPPASPSPHAFAERAVTTEPCANFLLLSSPLIPPLHVSLQCGGISILSLTLALQYLYPRE